MLPSQANTLVLLIILKYRIMTYCPVHQTCNAQLTQLYMCIVHSHAPTLPPTGRCDAQAGYYCVEAGCNCITFSQSTIRSLTGLIVNLIMQLHT